MALLLAAEGRQDCWPNWLSWMCTRTRSRNGEARWCWKRNGLPVRRGQGRDEGVCRVADLKALHAKIGELTLENDFLAWALTARGLAERKAMIDP